MVEPGVFKVSAVPIYARDLVGEITMTIRIKGWKTARGRIWLGCQIMRFGAWITGVNVKLEDEPKGS